MRRKRTGCQFRRATRVSFHTPTLLRI